MLLHSYLYLPERESGVHFKHRLDKRNIGVIHAWSYMYIHHLDQYHMYLITEGSLNVDKSREHKETNAWFHHQIYETFMHQIYEKCTIILFDVGHVSENIEPIMIAIVYLFELSRSIK